MQSFLIEKTNSTPFIQYNEGSKILSIKGESFPENAAKFYAPLIQWLKDFLSSPDEFELKLEFKIVYFNSSTSKIFFMLFELMEEGYNNGKDINVIWRCDPENRIALECGEEFKEDLNFLPFYIEV